MGALEAIMVTLKFLTHKLAEFHYTANGNQSPYFRKIRPFGFLTELGYVIRPKTRDITRI